MKIGTTIRGYRLQKGLSQGDIEKRTGLLRCYLSRVENGHTVPSLDTLAKIAQALDLPLAQFFAEDSLGREMNTQKLTDEELRFLTQIRRYSSNLNDSAPSSTSSSTLPKASHCRRIHRVRSAPSFGTRSTPNSIPARNPPRCAMLSMRIGEWKASAPKPMTKFKTAK